MTALSAGSHMNYNRGANKSKGTQVLIDQATFPSTRYQGSKSKLVDWIWDHIADIDFHTCLDAFGGTGVVAYRLKQAGKQVTYNDHLRFNHRFGQALIENARVTLTGNDVTHILTRQPGVAYPTFVQDTFPDIYFTDEENAWIDQTITNVNRLVDPYKRSLAFFALAQACIVKRPYNLFHRKNLYMRFADVKRSFGNKASWDKPFPDWFREFVNEANRAVFDNGQPNQALNLDAAAVPGDFDLVYVDTPYISHKGVGVDYHAFYHFLEGLTRYAEWGDLVDFKSKHRRLSRQPNKWTDKRKVNAAFDALFRRYRDSVIVVSYRSDGIPSVANLTHILECYKTTVRVEHFGQYQYALSTNNKSSEVLLIGT